MRHTLRVRLVQLTDLHLDRAEPFPEGVDSWGNFEWALTTAVSHNPDLIVVTGDLCLHVGTRATYEEIADRFSQLSVDVLVTPGNHDDPQLLAESFGRRYAQRDPDAPRDRVCDAGGQAVVLLDTSQGHIEQRQLLWLEALVASYAEAAVRGATGERLVVCTHYPIMTGFSRYMDREWALDGAERVLAVLASAPQLEVTILCGHYHTESVMSHRTVTQYCTPSLLHQIDRGAESFLVASAAPGVRVVDFPDAEPARSLVLYGTA